MDFIRSRIRLPHLRVDQIARAELGSRLAVALKSRTLVVLVAPAGYGKTVALARQLRCLPPTCAVAWVTADEELDFVRTLRCIAEALEPYDPPWRMAPEALAGQFAQEYGLRSTAAEFVNVLDAIPVTHGVIAIDDVHCISDPRLFEFLGLVLDSLPEAWTVVLAGRVDPPLPLARLRARRQLAEFRQDDLSFSLEDVATLCRQRGQDDGSSTVQLLHDQTNGWAVGVCLSLDTWNGSGRVGGRTMLSQRHLFDYLSAEVFDQQPQELRDLLVQCSVLDELTVPRCVAVSGNPNAGALLEEIERRGLFVSVLDAEELTLRLHDLTRAYLEERLRKEHPEWVPILLRRAADCERDAVRKVVLLLRAGACTEAEHAFLVAAKVALVSGNHSEIPRLHGLFPRGVREVSPYLNFGLGLHAWAANDIGSMEMLMDRAARGFERLALHNEFWRARGYYAMALAFFGRLDDARGLALPLENFCDDLEASALQELTAIWDTGMNGPAEGPGFHLDRLTDLLVATTDPALWYMCVCVYSTSTFLGRPGVREAMQRLIEGARAMVGEEHVLIEMQVRRNEIWISLWQGKVRDAMDLVQLLVADGYWLGQLKGMNWKTWPLPAMGAAMRGKLEDLNAVFADESAAISARHPRQRRIFVVLKSICYAALEQWQTVRELVDEIGPWPLWGVFRPLLESRLALAEGRDADALAPLQKLVATSAKVDRFGLNAMARVSLAIAELRIGSPSAAWRALAPLLDQVRASGEVGGVLLCGAGPLQELARADWQAAASADGMVEIKRWARLSEELRSPTVTDGSQLPPRMHEDQLSTREFEVLALIGEGGSNKLIARKLQLSPHTVKRHVARILHRLELSSRVEAATWYYRHSQLEQGRA